MGKKNGEEEFLEELRQEFVENVPYEITSCEEALLEYEKTGSEASISNLKKILHSLKGSAQAVDMHEAASFLHSIESSIDSFESSLDRQTRVSRLLKMLDTLKDKIDEAA